ncbi:unnamed protein product [Paramecium sonneborni]|uniref:CCT domain-containing protein n=1 Tax=Paramecium sonneborni TaxID=65129 RepID=A0A8S1MEC6_9CILI|nr:unnamed protein product [Paramecium sonneborni]
MNRLINKEKSRSNEGRKEQSGLFQNYITKKDLEQVSGILQPQLRTLNFDELTNGTLDDHMSCQTFLHCLPNQDNLDSLSDDHMCPYKRKYIIDQLKNVINQGQGINLSLLRALQKRTDSCEKKSDINALTDDENISNRGLEQIKTVMDKYQERQQKIQRYKNKRRNWERKISYSGRSQVAEQRLRIKGRFISKEDQQSIKKLICNKQQEDFYDKKHNLNIEKFHQHTKLFTYAEDPKMIPKKQILMDIRDEFQFQQQQLKILKSIKNKTKIFEIVQKQKS